MLMSGCGSITLLRGGAKMAVMASIAAELNQLANISDDDDFILLRVESILDTLGHFAAVTNSDVDPRVINSLSEVVQCLQVR